MATRTYHVGRLGPYGDHGGHNLCTGQNGLLWRKGGRRWDATYGLRVARRSGLWRDKPVRWWAVFAHLCNKLVLEEAMQAARSVRRRFRSFCFTLRRQDEMQLLEPKLVSTLLYLTALHDVD